jgi:uncharacterized protein YhbP (UPF0306 family)
MQPLDLIRSYLPTGRMMQVATVHDDQPWICTVYFVEDDDLNLYWLSLPSRRHSLEIAKHNKIAVAVPIKFDKPVIGIQAEGTAVAVADKELIADVMQRYVERYNSGKQFYDNFVAGKNQHVLFKFTPKKYVLFDEVSFPDDGRKEISLEG